MTTDSTSTGDATRRDASALQRGVRPGAEARSRWYDCGLSWALADSFASPEKDEWTEDDIARAFEAGAMSGVAAEREQRQQAREELVQAWNNLPDALRCHPGLKRLYAAAQRA